MENSQFQTDLLVCSMFFSFRSSGMWAVCVLKMCTNCAKFLRKLSTQTHSQHPHAIRMADNKCRLEQARWGISMNIPTSAKCMLQFFLLSFSHLMSLFVFYSNRFDFENSKNTSKLKRESTHREKTSETKSSQTKSFSSIIMNWEKK